MKMLHTMLRVRDLQKSLEFYCGFVGLHETRRTPIGEEAKRETREGGSKKG
jgi:catechol 2,3-dioxygenase-like lactoylglutathione lyase family enzyme